MKGFIITGLSTLVLGSFLAPVNLVNHARGGTFSEQGIPGYISLSLAVKSGQIDAETLVKTAIKTGRLSSEILNNNLYLSAVDFELSQLDND